MNKIKKKEKSKKKKKKTASSYSIRKFLNALEFIQQEFLRRVMPFLFFLTILGLVYIANIYQAERTIRNIDKIGKEIKELRSEYISGKSEIMYSSNQSEIAKSISEHGIKESIIPPKKIVIRD
ncbi:MAG: hypothetical protein HKN22_07400 [Bacteroidia bacterium]|nr:hypothetical protein [Bacteroidia bacterium]